MSLFGLFRKEQQPSKDKSNKQIKDSSFYSQSLQSLPQNFAQQVMQLEMQLEFIESYDMEIVHKLNQNYRIAIEHYINVDPRKANHFQRKLTNLLTHPHTLQIIQKTQKLKSVNAKQQQPIISTHHYNAQLKQQLNKFNSQSQILVKSIIEGSKKKFERSSKTINTNLNNQQDTLQKRLLARSKSRSKNKIQTSTSPFKTQPNFD